MLCRTVELETTKFGDVLTTSTENLARKARLGQPIWRGAGHESRLSGELGQAGENLSQRDAVRSVNACASETERERSLLD